MRRIQPVGPTGPGGSIEPRPGPVEQPSTSDHLRRRGTRDDASAPAAGTVRARPPRPQGGTT
ncbi:hypothetical protein FTX61_05935 [Nitriliruptoraceae bacterium ZYF776]|nr:hypothetical protein [Profundirhabdus halotolerans]